MGGKDLFFERQGSWFLFGSRFLGLEVAKTLVRNFASTMLSFNGNGARWWGLSRVEPVGRKTYRACMVEGKDVVWSFMQVGVARQGGMGEQCRHASGRQGQCKWDKKIGNRVDMGYFGVHAWGSACMRDWAKIGNGPWAQSKIKIKEKWQSR